jgi:DNA (cytosine-5)-methyltransferase 1
MGDDETTRSGLFMEQIRIIKEQRNESIRQLSMRGSVVDIRHIQPRYTIWENVCGAFSSNNGEDFRAVLEETCKVADENAYVPRLEKGQKWAYAGCIMGDGYSVAWRVHDAQYWGVPQRRKRICLLADYGGATAPEILFELIGEADNPEAYKAIANTGNEPGCQIQSVGKGVSGNTEQGSQEGQGITETSTDSTGTSSYTLKVRGGIEVDSKGHKAGKGALVQEELSGTLGVSQDQTLITKCLNPWDVQSKHIQPQEGIAESLYSGECRYGGGESYVLANNEKQQPMVVGCDLYNQTLTGDKTMSITGAATDSHHVPCAVYGVVAKGNGDAFLMEEKHTSLSTGGGEPGQGYPTVCYGISSYESNSMKSSNPHSGVYEADTTRTLDNNGGNPACNQGGVAVVQAFDGLNNATSEEVSPTLMCQRQDVKNIPSVAYGLDRASFNQGQNAKFDITVDTEIAPLDCQGSGSGSNIKLMDAYQHHGWRESDNCGTLTAGQNGGIRGDTPLVIEERLEHG